jgi:glycosyltransferase involved in cell wall biosynthesis
MWVRSRGRTPFVYDAHDFYPAGYSVAPGEALWIRALIWLERRCVRHASAVVTVTEGCADLIEDYFGRRPAVVRNVHDPRIDQPVPRDLRKELGLGARDFLVVMAGNAKAGTAVDQALAAWRQLPDRAHLALVGGGWEAYENAVASLDLAGRVHLCGPLLPTQVVPFISTADAALILYLPHSVDYVYALPNRLFLPISAGLPLIFPRHLTELRALAEANGLGLAIDPERPSSIVAAVLELMEDDAALARYRANAATARSVFTWEREEGRWGALLSAALVRDGRGGKSPRFPRGSRGSADSR